MQDSTNLDAQLRTLISKSSKTKPFGFALVPESEDGTPALFIEKKEAMARKEAKDELKVAKKKAILTGLIYIDEKKIHLLPGIKALKEPVINKYFKKLKLKTSKYKGLFGSAPLYPEATIVEDDFAEEAPKAKAKPEIEETETQEQATDSTLADPKYLAILEKLESKLEDLKNNRQETANLYQKVAGIFQSSLNSDIQKQLDKLDELSGKLETIAKACQDLDASMQKFRTVVTINDKSGIKKLGKELQTALKENEAVLEGIVNELNSFDITTGDMNNSDQEKSVSEMSNIEIYLKQAKALRASSMVQDMIHNTPEPGFFDKLFANRNKQIKAAAAELDEIINQIDVLFRKEGLGESVSAKQDQECEKKLFTIRQKFSDLLVATKLPKNGSISQKVDAIWGPALRQSQAELQRFKAAVFAHSVVTSDPSFAVIQKKVSEAHITLPDLKGINSKSDLKTELKKINAAKEMDTWKEIDASSLFGKFSVAHPVLQAIETLSNL